MGTGLWGLMSFGIWRGRFKHIPLFSFRPSSFDLRSLTIFDDLLTLYKFGINGNEIYLLIMKTLRLASNL